MTIWTVFAVLWIFTRASMGSQDPVICVFTEVNQCYVALGRQLHLQMPLEKSFDLKVMNKTSPTRIIFKYRLNQINLSSPYLPRWKFIRDNKTMILSSVLRSDVRTYTLETFNANGKAKGTYHLQLEIEENSCTQSYDVSGFQVFVSVWLLEVIILLSLLMGMLCVYARIYRKRRKASDRHRGTL